MGKNENTRVYIIDSTQLTEDEFIYQTCTLSVCENYFLPLLQLKKKGYRCKKDLNAMPSLLLHLPLAPNVFHTYSEHPTSSQCNFPMTSIDVHWMVCLLVG